MVLNLVVLAQKYNFKINGVIQLGAHFFEEKEVFKDLGVKRFVLVEPLNHAYIEVLKRTSGMKEVSAFKVAVGNEEGIKTMFVDDNNEGQSSSFLRPKEHLERHPDIKFTKQEDVYCTKLDLLPFDRSNFNFICMDLQGFELPAMKGAIQTLPHVDYIYSEVNKSEIYEGCTRIEDLDHFLSGFGFERIETHWWGGNYGDAMYIKKKAVQPYEIKDMSIIDNNTPSNHTFIEADYLALNQDVAEAIRKGHFKTGLQHYEMYGKSEGRNTCMSSVSTTSALSPTKYIESNTKDFDVSNIQSIQKIISDTLGNIPANLGINIVNTPEAFRTKAKREYPDGNTIEFEEYFYNYFLTNKPATDRVYLPIFWTAYYCNNSYGKDNASIRILQEFLNQLPRDKKYFTVVQYDDGILNYIGDLDIIVYASGSDKQGYYPIPLICKNNLVRSQVYRSIKYSFIGLNTHPIRQTIYDQLKNDSSHIYFSNIQNRKLFEQLLNESIFSLCPRGYGASSFRISESLQLGSIPVYISDSFIEPFNLPFEEYGVKIRPDQIKDIPAILNQCNIDKLAQNGIKYFEQYFTYDGCAKSILKTLV